MIAADGIRANPLSPGATDTLRAALQRFPSRQAANGAKAPRYLLNRAGKAREIADGGYLAFKGSLTHPA